MIQTLERYKAFAFAMMIKKGRANGMYYSHENLHSFYTNLHLKGRISYNTFRKYMNMLFDFDLIVMQGSERQLVNINSIAERLDIDIEHKKINQLYRERDINQLSFKQTLNWILSVLIDSNFRAQHFCILQNNKRSDIAHHLLNGTNNGDSGFHKALRKIANEAEQQGMDSVSYAASVLRDGVDYIKTGSYYLAKKFNISQSKANRILNQMEKDGMIKRYVKKINYNLPVTYESFDYLKKATGGKTIIPTKKNGFIQVLGSEIMLPTDKKGKPKMFFEKNEIVVKENNSLKDILNKFRQKNGLNRQAAFNTKVHEVINTIQLNLSNSNPTPNLAEIREVSVNVDKDEVMVARIEAAAEPIQIPETNSTGDEKEALINQIKSAIFNNNVTVRQDGNLLFIETVEHPQYVTIGLRQTIEGEDDNIVITESEDNQKFATSSVKEIPEWIKTTTLFLS